jgi:hypothetical protein
LNPFAFSFFSFYCPGFSSFRQLSLALFLSYSLEVCLVFTLSGLSFGHAFTVSVVTSTFIAEVFAATTRHVITTGGPFYPKVAMWTLLKFFPLNKLHESFITFPFVV